MSKITQIKPEKEEITQVINVTPAGKRTTRLCDQRISGSARFGKELKITPKANATINTPGFATKFFVPTVSINIGIGNDYSAYLIMTVDAWEALKSGQKVHITTTEEWKDKYERTSKNKK